MPTINDILKKWYAEAMARIEAYNGLGGSFPEDSIRLTSLIEEIGELEKEEIKKRLQLQALALKWASEGEFWDGTPEDSRSLRCCDELLTVLRIPYRDALQNVTAHSPENRTFPEVRNLLKEFELSEDMPARYESWPHHNLQEDLALEAWRIVKNSAEAAYLPTGAKMTAHKGQLWVEKKRDEPLGFPVATIISDLSDGALGRGDGSYNAKRITEYIALAVNSTQRLLEEKNVLANEVLRLRAELAERKEKSK